MTARRRNSDVALTIACMALAYGIVANIVFAIRHPWTTSTERFLALALPTALVLGTIDYDEWRPRR